MLNIYISAQNGFEPRLYTLEVLQLWYPWQSVVRGAIDILQQAVAPN